MELKQRMTFEEMAMHLKEHSFKLPSRVTVGKHAKELGYKVYKPMIKGKIHFFYVKVLLR
ncbi:hypothetical protein IR083_07615 [Dysgonomonas sp. GY75]|uniref:hypothetical protein n=1 Tax=Dysgonomonas sp. GY75 TaxID=2780419 RepID=UPI001883449B|nr:hypothetical protein [Dysgonomonas sp. GY75]MBF0648684.1 hypothetical protein [Dysgonomonas sp. GY75]